MFLLKFFEFLVVGKFVVGFNFLFILKMKKLYVYEYVEGDYLFDFIVVCEKVIG